MPEVEDVFFNNPSYGATSKVSDWINVSPAEQLNFVVFCSHNCNVVIEWSADNNPVQIIETDTYSLIGGSEMHAKLNTKWRYARFSVINIASTPNDLKCQLFY